MMEQPILDPPIPYIGPVVGGRFSPGKVIRIQGVVPGVAYRFDVNLQCGPEISPRDDIALQVAVRILDGFIAINSLQNGIWGEEVQRNTQPIKRAERFEMIIMCDFNKYKVVINGLPFCDFPQRIHYDCITHLTIEGDVSIIQILYGSQSVPSSTIASGPTPVTLRHTNDDFEIINTRKPIDIGFSEPPSYSEVVHQYPPNVPPYPVKNSQGMPQPAPYPIGTPSAPYPASTSSIPSPSAAGALLSPSTNVPIPLNAASSNFRPVKKANTKKLCGYFWAIFIGVLIIIAVVLIKATRSNKTSYKSYNNYDTNSGRSFSNSGIYMIIITTIAIGVKLTG